MTHAAIVVGEQRRRRVVHDRALELVAGKGADRLERPPPRDDDYFHAAGVLAFEEPRAVITVDGRQLRQHRLAKMLGVGRRAFPRRARAPHPFDHQSAGGGAAASPPMTTFQGRTCHAVTSPSRTYGSARANSSTADALSLRNTSNAPSGGSPSAPASRSRLRSCASRTRRRCASRNAMRRLPKSGTTS